MPGPGRTRHVFLLGVIVCGVLVTGVVVPGIAQTVPGPVSDDGTAVSVPPTTTQATVAPNKAEARRLSKTVFWLFIIFIVTVFAVVIFVMLSRRFRAFLGLGGRHREPTPTDDVWAMHKLPDGAIDELEDDEQ